jgi:hypothetical protein
MCDGLLQWDGDYECMAFISRCLNFHEAASCGVKVFPGDCLVLSRVFEDEAVGTEYPRPVVTPHHRCTMLQL